MRNRFCITRVGIAGMVVAIMSVVVVVGTGMPVSALERTTTAYRRTICNVGAFGPSTSAYGVFAACSFDPTVAMFPSSDPGLPIPGVYSSFSTLTWPRVDGTSGSWVYSPGCTYAEIGGTLYVGPGITTPEGLVLGEGQLYVSSDIQSSACDAGIRPTAKDCFAYINPGDNGLNVNVGAARVKIGFDNASWSSAPFCFNGATEVQYGASWLGLFPTKLAGAQSATLWPDDWMEHSEPGESAPASRCQSTEVAILEDGEWLDPAVVSSGRVLTPGSLIELRVDWGGTPNPAGAPGFAMGDFGWSVRVGTAGIWRGITPSSWDGETMPITGYEDVDTRFTADVSFAITETIEVGSLFVRCNDPQLPGEWFWIFGLDWGNDEDGRRACAVLQVHYPTASQTTETPVGGIVRYGYTMGTAPTLDDVLSLEWRYGEDVVVVTDFFDQDGNARAGGYEISPGDRGFFEVEFPVAVDWSEPRIWCEDSLGFLRMVMNGGNLDPVNEDGESCYDSVSIGLNPASWLPAGFRIGVCTVRWLVLPSPGFVSDWATDQQETLSDVPPFSFGMSLIEFGQQLSDEVENPSGDGCFSVGIPVGGLGSSEMCVGADISTSGGQRSLIAVFVIVPLVLGLLARGFSMLRAP